VIRSLTTEPRSGTMQQGKQPTVLLIGDVPLVMPMPADRLGPLREARVLRMEAMHRSGADRRSIEIMVVAAEAAWGITHQDRIDAMKVVDESWEEDLMGALFSPADVRPARSLKIHLPDDERGLAAGQLKRFDKLQRKIEMPTTSKAEREEALAEVTYIERSAKDRQEADALDRYIQLMHKLEHGRDPSAPIERDKTGRIRIMARDGLECLLMAQALTAAQYTAGMRYREMYEATERSIRSNLNRDISGGEDKRKLEDVGQKMLARRRLETKVQDASKNGRGLMTLRLIAGQGRTLYAISPKSNANQALYRDALVIALDVVRQHFGIH
jgi:hypothetical protein